MEQKPLIVAGIDLGAATTKAVILSDSKVLLFSVVPTDNSVAQATYSLIGKALVKLYFLFNDLKNSLTKLRAFVLQ